jgi:hypothetical protein
MSTRKDIFLIKEFVLPSAAGTVQSEAFDLFEAKTKADIHNMHMQLEVSLPDITLPASTTLSVSVESSNDSTFATDKQSAVLGTLTAGDIEGQKFYTKPSEKPLRYWRAVITTTGSTGNLSAHNAAFAIVF